MNENQLLNITLDANNSDRLQIAATKLKIDRQKLANMMIAEKLSNILDNQPANIPIIDEEKIAQLYAEFAEEDRELAELGINEYYQLLEQEDL
jgi:hypothetical protein